MKNFFLIFFLIGITNIVEAQIISVDSLIAYADQKITVCAKVQSIYVSNKTKKTTFINFGNPYPNQKFVVIIFEKDLANFKYEPAIFLANKTVCVTGTVKIYNGLPEIIATEEKQIEIQ